MIKKIIIALVSLIVLLIVAVGIFLATFDLNHYREFAEKKLSLILDRPVQIGAMHTKLSLIPTIEISNFRILDSKENPNPILEIPQMDATLKMVPLIKNFQVDIQKIDVLLVSVNLTNMTFKDKKQESQKNQQTENEKKEANPKHTLDLNNFWIKNITVNRTLLRFMNKGEKDAIELNNLVIKDLNNLKFQVAYHKKNFNVDGSFGILTKLIIEQKELPINLKIKQGIATLTLKGQIGNLPKMEKIKINGSLNMSKLKTFLKTWDIDLSSAFDTNFATKFYLDGNLEKLKISNFETNIARESFVIKANGEALNLKENPTVKLNLDINLKDGELSKKMNLNPIEFTTDLTLDSNSLNLNNLLFRSGHSDLSGNFKLDWKEKLTIRPNLKSSYLDLKDILKEGGLSKKQTKSQPQKKKQTLAWQKKRINWDILQKFDINGKIDIDHLFATNLITTYVGLSLEANSENGVLNSSIKSKALSGQIDANLNLNAKEQTVRLNLIGQDLNLDKIRAVYPRVHDAHINTEISLNTKGKTYKELFANADGKIITELLEGAVIVDKWFNSLPVTLTAAKKRTDFLDFSTTDNKTEILCATMNLPIKKGVLLSDNAIAIQTSAFNLVLDGSVNMKNETVDLSIIPSISHSDQTNQLLNLTQFIQLTGPWDNLSWRLDKKKILTNLVKGNSTKQALDENKFGLCQKALGRELHLEHPNKMRQKKTTPQKQPKEEKKENLKDLLRKSLSPVFSKVTQ